MEHMVWATDLNIFTYSEVGKFYLPGRCWFIDEDVLHVVT